MTKTLRKRRKRRRRRPRRKREAIPMYSLLRRNHNNETPKERPIVQVNVNGTLYEMLADTGATVSAMSDRRLLNLNLKHKKKPSHVKLMPCGRHKLPCNNQFDAILKSGNKECFETIYIVSEEDLKIPILSYQASLILGFIKFLGAVRPNRTKCV